MTKDMTNGSPMKLILGFSIPLLFGYLFQQFYNLVDTLIVGRVLGVDALAAVGSTGSLNFLIIGFCMGVCNGFAIPLAHKFGAGDYRGLRAFMVNAIYLSAICSGHDGSHSSILPPDLRTDAHAGQHYRRGVSVYRDHFCRNTGNIFV